MVRITPDGTRISGPARRNTFRAAADGGGLKWKRRDGFAPRPIAGEEVASPRQSSQDTSVQLVLRMTVAPPSFEASLSSQDGWSAATPINAGGCGDGYRCAPPILRDSRDRDAGSTVIASEAQQSSPSPDPQYGFAALRSQLTWREQSSPHERSDMRDNDNFGCRCAPPGYALLLAQMHRTARRVRLSKSNNS